MSEIDNLIEDFLRYLLIDKGYSKNTISSYRIDLERFNEYFKNKGINEIDNSDLKKYIKSLDLNEKSISRTISSLKSFYKFLIIEKIVKNNPTDGLYMPKVKKSLPNIMSVEDVTKLLDIKLDDHFSYRNKAMLELMYATGLRVSELVNLKVYDVNLEEAIVKTMGKGSKERIIPIGEIATNAVNDYLKIRNTFLKRDLQSYWFT